MHTGIGIRDLKDKPLALAAHWKSILGPASSRGVRGEPGKSRPWRQRLDFGCFEANLAQGPHQGLLSPATPRKGKRASLQETDCRSACPRHLQPTPNHGRSSPPFLLRSRAVTPRVRDAPWRRARATGPEDARGITPQPPPEGMLQAFISEDEGDDVSHPQDRETPAAPGTQRTAGSVKGRSGWKDVPSVPRYVPVQGWGTRRDPAGG